MVKGGHGMTSKFLTVLLVLISLSGLSGCGFSTSPGSGDKIGQIVKISKQGLIVKTWEAQLIRGGMNGGSGSSIKPASAGR